MRTSSFSFRDQTFHFQVAVENDVIQSHYLKGEFYELEELALIERHFPPGGVFLDVGANVGNHSVYMARLHGAQCVCVEPNPVALGMLHANLGINKVDACVIEAGLGKERSLAGLTCFPHNLGGTRLTLEGDVLVERGDILLEEHAVSSIDFIKMDVEGMEMEALAGLEHTILRDRPPIFVEVENAHIHDVVEWSLAHNYELAAEFRRYAACINLLLLPIV